MSSKSASDGSPMKVRATIGKIEGDDRDRFAVCYLSPGVRSFRIADGESITFSLSDWKGSREPQRGQLVFLGEIYAYAKGWRARSAEPVTPTQIRGEVQR